MRDYQLQRVAVTIPPPPSEEVLEVVLRVSLALQQQQAHAEDS